MEDATALGRPRLGILCADKDLTVTHVAIPQQTGSGEADVRVTDRGLEQLKRWFLRRPQMTPVGYIKVCVRLG